MSTKDWTNMAELAEHYLAVGQDEVYLHPGPYPWDHISEAKFPDGSIWHNQDGRFRATHDSGVTFRWTAQLTDHKGVPELETIRQVKAALKDQPEMMTELETWVELHVHNIQLEINEHKSHAKRLQTNAEMLAEIISY